MRKIERSLIYWKVFVAVVAVLVLQLVVLVLQLIDYSINQLNRVYLTYCAILIKIPLIGHLLLKTCKKNVLKTRTKNR